MCFSEKESRGKVIFGHYEEPVAEIVTAKELGQYLKLSESTIYKLAQEGELPGFKVGDSWRFDMEEVLKAIKGSQKGNHRKSV